MLRTSVALRRVIAAAFVGAAAIVPAANADDPVPVSCSVSIAYEGCTYYAIGATGTLTVDVSEGDAYGIVTCSHGGTGLWQYGPGRSSIEFTRLGYCVAYFTPNGDNPSVAVVTSN